jgi:hypothetical protein
MTNTIRIGEQATTTTKRRARGPLTFLPVKLDAAACLDILERIDPEASAESISAARQSVNVDSVDSALEYSTLSISDKIRFKTALAAHGILGKRS